jgi:hypothetical protein
LIEDQVDPPDTRENADKMKLIRERKKLLDALDKAEQAVAGVRYHISIAKGTIEDLR